MQTDVKGMKEDIHVLQTDVKGMKEDIQILQTNVKDMRADIRFMQADIRVLQTEVHNLKLCQENIILPRLNTIEACYTDTYRRYACYTDRIEAVFEDVRVLKLVAADHSERLQKLA